MNKKITLIFALILIVFSLKSEQTQGELFRDTEHKYRIRFPWGWDIVDGDGEHIKKKALNENGSSVYVLSMFTDAEEMDAEDFKKESEDLLSAMKQNVFQRFYNVRIVDEGIQFLSNRPFLYLKFIHTKKELDYEINEIRLTYTTINDSVLYVVGGGGYELFFEDDKFEILESIRSFIIEDFDKNISYEEFKKLKSLKQSKKANWKPFLYIIFFVFVIIVFKLLSIHKRRNSEMNNLIYDVDNKRKKMWKNLFITLIICVICGIGNSLISQPYTEFWLFFFYSLGGFLGCIGFGLVISSIIYFIKNLFSKNRSNFSNIFMYVCMIITIMTIYGNYSLNK